MRGTFESDDPEEMLAPLQVEGDAKRGGRMEHELMPSGREKATAYSLRTFAALASGRPQMSMKPAADLWLNVSPTS